MRALFDRRGARSRAERRGARALAHLIACGALVAACASGASAFALVSFQVGGDAPDLTRVETTLEALPGVLEVQVEPRDARVDVAYDPARSTHAQLLEAIHGLGYEAEAVFRRATPPAASEPLPPPPEGGGAGGG